MGDLSFQVHHIIPINVFNEFVDIFPSIFDTPKMENIIQSYNNRIALFTDDAPANALRNLHGEGGLKDAPLGSAQHYTSHPKYDNAIREIINDIVKSELTPPQKRTMLIDMQYSLREMLQSGQPPIYADEAIISDTVKRGMASVDEIRSGKGDNYTRALEREARYDKNNEKYPDLMNDPVKKNAKGKFASKGNKNDTFVEKTGHEIAKALLDADKDAADQNKKAGKEEKGFLNDGSRIALEEVVNGTRKDNNRIRDAIAKGVYDYKTNPLANSHEPTNSGDEGTKKGNTHANQSGTHANEGGAHANQGGTNNNQGSAGSKNRGRGVSLSSTGIKRQGGFVDFGDIAHAAGRTAHDLARDLGHSLTRSNLLAQNVMIPDGKGGIRFNPDLAEGRVGNFIKDKFWAGKVGALGGIAAFLDNTFNGLVKGIETGDWRDFQDQAFQYGEEAVKSTIGFVAATELVSFTTALMGAPYVLVGELALAGLMLYGAFQIGWSIGSLLRKGWNWLTGNHEDWDNLPREDGYIVYDPLTLDLDGDGIEAIASNGHKGALFDHDKDGIRTATGWISKDDGLLIYDRNGDGVVNDGSELFGDNTLLKNGERAANGYQALAELDDNGDGKVDTADSAFAHLRVWRDLNQDGISQEGELLTLEEAKVKALNLANQNRDRDLGNGNTLAEEGTYTDSDGNEKQMGDLNLAADHFHSRYADSLPLTDEQQQAPNLRGSGRVRDLREAAAESPDVAAALQAYANAQTKEEQLALRDQLLRAWAGTDKRFTTEGVLKAASKNVVMASKGKNAVRLTPGQAAALGTIQGPSIWSLLGIEDPEQKKKAALLEKVGILDAFTGTDSSHLYYGTKLQAQHIIDTIEKTYANLADNLYDGLLFQTRLKPYLNAIRFGMSEDGKLQLDYSGVAALFDEVHAKNPGKAFTDLGELLAKGNADGKNTDMAPLAEKFVQYAQEASSNGTFEAYGHSLGEKALTSLGYRLGTDSDDTLRGNDSANYLYGGKGNDSLTGGAGHDTLEGGSGDDHLEGGTAESDTYLFRAGHGKDTVKDYGYTDEQADTLRFEGAQAEKTTFAREGNDLVVKAYGSDDRVALKDYFYSDNDNRYHFQFEDSKMGREDIIKKAFDFTGTENNDRINGWYSDDTIHGGAGDDTLYSYGGNDTLHGDSGNDGLNGGDGNDVLHGGEGDDALGGDSGNDVLHGGEGNDRLYGGAGHDTLEGGAGDDHLEGGTAESDTYLFRAGHGKDMVKDYSYNDEQADTLHFEGAQAEKTAFAREGNDLVVKAYGSDDRVALKDYFYNDNYSRYDFQFDDATFKAAELRGKDLPTEGLKAPVAATAQTTDVATPDSATATVTPQEKAATATTDDSKAQVANTPEKIVAVDTFHPPLQLHKDGAASTDAVQKADSATVSGNDAGENARAVQTSADTKVQSAATDTATQAAVPASGKATQIVAATSVDSRVASKADTQSATVQQNAAAVDAVLKTGGATATPASTLDAKAAQQSQQMLSAMATQSQTATPTALAAPDLQPMPQLVASQV